MAPRAQARRVAALVLASLAALAGPVSADPAARLPLRDYVRRVWTTADGLPQNSVRAIVQSREGYLWLATSEGLTRFDGARLTVLDRQSLSSLPSPNISAIVLDRAGDIWIGFKRDGLARLRGDKVERWTRAEGLPSHATTALVEDALPNGEIAVVNAQVTAFHQAMFASALLAAVGIVAAMFVRDSDAAPSMHRDAVAAEAH